MFPEKRLMTFIQCDYSRKKHKLKFIILFSFRILFVGEGGDLTLFMTGKKKRPSTEPMYSGGNRTEFPITSGITDTHLNNLYCACKALVLCKLRKCLRENQAGPGRR